MSDEPADRAPPRRQSLAQRLRPARNLTSAVYGSVLAASVIVGSGDSHGGVAARRDPAGHRLRLLGRARLRRDGGVGARRLAASARSGTGMRHEWPLMVASILPAIAAAVTAAFENASPADGAWVALAVAIAEQQVWGADGGPAGGLTGGRDGPHDRAEPADGRRDRRAEAGRAEPLSGRLQEGLSRRDVEVEVDAAEIHRVLVLGTAARRRSGGKAPCRPRPASVETESGTAGGHRLDGRGRRGSRAAGRAARRRRRAPARSTARSAGRRARRRTR